VSIEGFNNVLVLAPHTDDGEFGCGGTMARLIENGVKVTYAAFSTAAKSVSGGVSVACSAYQAMPWAQLRGRSVGSP